MLNGSLSVFNAKRYCYYGSVSTDSRTSHSVCFKASDLQENQGGAPHETQ